MIKAVIFDLDGVITDTAEYHFLSWKKLSEDYNIPFNHMTKDDFRGFSRMKSLEILLTKQNLKHKFSNSKKEELTTIKNQYYLEMIEGIGPKDFLPGAKELIQNFKKKKIKQAVASSSKNAKPVLKRLKIIHEFCAVIDGYDIKQAKPRPEIFLLAAKQLGINPKNCLVIEDAVSGIEAGKRAGMKTLGLGSKKLLKDADLVLNSLENVNLEQLLNL